jgi:hypothetical protein
MERSLRRTLSFTEWGTAGLLTSLLVFLHVTVLTHAGPLWRDEISSLRLATMPTLAGFWASIAYDPVPALFFWLLRAWHFSGLGATDEGLRVLGYGIGLGMVAAVWLAAWATKKSPPSWALLLLCLSPIALVWGDSLRAYGLSCIWNILTVACFSKLLTRTPRARDIALAALAALLSVQSLFPNSLLLFAACLGGITVALRRRWRKAAWSIFLIGGAAALSLLPYANILHRTREWSSLCKTGSDCGWILKMLFGALAAGGNLGAALWICLSILALVAVSLSLAKPSVLDLRAAEQDTVLFAGITLFGAVGATIWFFRTIGWTTSPWYYLPLMGTAAVCLDSISFLVRKNIFTGFLCSGVIVAAAAVMAPSVYRTAKLRRTNVDLIAEAVASLARESDLVVVDNLFYSVSFQRYYHGKAPWLGVPPIDDFSLHRWDLVKQTMTRSRPIAPTLSQIDQTLQSGHNVYVVGENPINRAASPPPDLPPAPQAKSGWCAGPYVVRWAFQVAYAAQGHALHRQIIKVPCQQSVSDVEEIQVIVVSGWKDGLVANLP